MKEIKPILCEFCGKAVSEEMRVLYGAHCSWTCLSRHRKEKAAEKERKREAARIRDNEKRSERKMLAYREKRPAVRRMKSIFQYTKDGVFMTRYASAHEAAQALGVDKSHIYSSCNGKSKNCRGFILKYE